MGKNMRITIPDWLYEDLVEIAEALDMAEEAEYGFLESKHSVSDVIYLAISETYDIDDPRQMIIDGMIALYEANPEKIFYTPNELFDQFEPFGFTTKYEMGTYLRQTLGIYPELKTHNKKFGTWYNVKDALIYHDDDEEVITNENTNDKR